MRRALAVGLAAFLPGAVVSLAWLPVPALRAEDAPAPDGLAGARAALEKGDYPAAKDLFLAAVKADPKSVEARRGAAETLLGLGESDAAIEQAYAGLEASGDKDAGLWLLAARAYLQKGDLLPPEKTEEIGNAYADAKAKAAMAIQLDGALNAARAVLAKACRLTNEADRAREVLAKGLEREPGSFDLHFEKGMLHMKTKEHAEAAASFTRAIQADPKSSDALYWKGYSLLFLKQTDDACQAFVRSAVLDPAPGIRRSLQMIAKYKSDGSIPYYRDILKDAPGHAWAHAYLAYYLAGSKTKDAAGAQKAMKSAVSLAPEDVDIASWEGRVLENLGERNKAIAVYMKVLKKNPMTKDAWERLREMSSNPAAPTKLEDRLEIIEFLGKTRPDDALFWNDVGLLHRDTTKDFRRSLDAYVKAAALAPEDQGIQNDTGLIFLYHGKGIGEDPRKGLPYFERTLALVDDGGQDPQMGARDSLENLCVYFGPPPNGIEANPERALEYAKRRNDPDFLAKLPGGIAQPSGRAASIQSWAEKELKRR